MKKKPHTSQYLRFAQAAYRLTQATLPRYGHRNSPHTYTQPQLAACVLLGIFLDCSWRDLEDWLLVAGEVRAALALQTVPDHATLYRTFQRLTLARVDTMHHQLLTELGIEEEAMIIDATGLRPTRAGQSYLSRTGRLMRPYIKAVVLVGVQHRFVLAWHFAHGPGGSDAQYLNRLRKQGHRYGCKVGGRREWVLLGDKGFDGAQARADDLICPRQGQHPVVRADRRARQDLTGQAQLDGFMGQRSHVESLFSVMKRKSGDALRSRCERLQKRELALKVLVYNLYH